MISRDCQGIAGIIVSVTDVVSSKAKPDALDMFQGQAIANPVIDHMSWCSGDQISLIVLRFDDLIFIVSISGNYIEAGYRIGDHLHLYTLAQLFAILE